jgi:hypothetical protein
MHAVLVAIDQRDSISLGALFRFFWLLFSRLLAKPWRMKRRALHVCRTFEKSYRTGLFVRVNGNHTEGMVSGPVAATLELHASTTPGLNLKQRQVSS